MDHRDILTKSATVLNQRSEQYGEMRDVMHRASLHSSLILGKEITPYQVCVILHSLKLSRIPSNLELLDNFVDGINYFAFAGEFAKDEAKKSKSNEELVDGIAEIARKFAPERYSTGDGSDITT